MARPKYNPDTVKAIIKVLLQHQSGIWLSKLARKAEVPVSTVAYYLDNQLSGLIDEHTFGEQRNIIRVISLKQRVLVALEEGKSMGKIMKMMKIIKDVE